MMAKRDADGPAAVERVAVVIVNYNDRVNLGACLESVPAHLTTVVIDNASTDGSVEFVRAAYPHVHVVADGTNPGYGAAANKGARLCRSEYVVVLNSDTVLAPGMVETLQAYLDEHPRVAVAGPRLLNADGSLQPSVFPLPGTLRWLLENDPVAPVIGLLPHARRHFYRFSPPTTATPVPWVLGAVLAIRQQPFRDVAGFDEAFFLYFEEVDLCARLWAAGWEVHFVPAASALHTGGSSTSRVRARAAIEHFRSTLMFYRRHYRGGRLFTWIALMRFKMVLRIVRDTVALATAREPLARIRLRDDLAAWREALRHTGR